MPPASSGVPRRVVLGLVLIGCLAAAMALILARSVYAGGKLAATAIEPAMTGTSRGWPEAGPRILVVGDSRVADWPIARSPRGAVGGLAKSGVGGETSVKLLARWRTMSRPSEGTCVLILTGINDLVAADLNPDRSAAIEAALIRNVSAIAADVRADGMEPIIGAIGQAGSIDGLHQLLGWSDDLRARVDRSNRKLREAALSAGSGWFDTNRALGVGADRQMPARFSTDTLHWNAAAYQALENALTCDSAGRRSR
jgi:lysophospholipase L1-like esterase